VWPRHARRGDRRVAYLHDVEAFDVICDVPVPLQVDGEYLGMVERVAVRYRRNAVRVFTPAAVSARGPASAAAGT
jgi:diacylglycerol kinase family enzyme